MCFKTSENGFGSANKLVIPNYKRYHHNLNQEFKKKAIRPPKQLPRFEYIKNMRMTRQVCDDIKNFIGKRPAESGGILLSESLDYTITTFVFDIASQRHGAIYQPNTDFLNSVLKGRNEQFIGIAHSHRNLPRLSAQDQRAAWSNMTSPGNPHLNAFLMPIIQTIPDTGRFEIISYIVTCHHEGNGRVVVRQVELEIID